MPLSVLFEVKTDEADFIAGLETSPASRDRAPSVSEDATKSYIVRANVLQFLHKMKTKSTPKNGSQTKNATAVAPVEMTVPREGFAGALQRQLRQRTRSY